MDAPAHKRVNDILLGPLERPALQWLAARLPEWVTPDMLTGLGLFASILIFAAYTATNLNPAFLWLASFGFVLNWFGDSLDGTLARYRHIERPRYGFFVDHIVDAASEVLVFLGIGLSPYVRFDLAIVTLVGYMLMSNLVYITTYVNGVFRISYIKLGPTEIRLIAILANTTVFLIGNPLLHLPFRLGSFSFYNLVAVALSILLFSVFIVVATLQALDLNRQDLSQRAQAKQGRAARKAARVRTRLAWARWIQRRSNNPGIPAD